MIRDKIETERYTLYLADSRLLLPKLNVNVDLLLTDPPYEMTAKGGGIVNARAYMHAIEGNLDSGFDMRILEPFDSWACFCGKGQLKDLLAATGTRRWSLVTWNKPNPTPLVNGNYLPDTEYIVHAYKSGRLFGEYKDRARFIVHPVEKNTFDHPTVKPVAVVAKMIRLGSQPDELVVDPYMGTATTGVACIALGRRFIGIEWDEKYFRIAARRMANESPPLFKIAREAEQAELFQ